MKFYSCWRKPMGNWFRRRKNGLSCGGGDFIIARFPRSASARFALGLTCARLIIAQAPYRGIAGPKVLHAADRPEAKLLLRTPTRDSSVGAWSQESRRLVYLTDFGPLRRRWKKVANNGNRLCWAQSRSDFWVKNGVAFRVVSVRQIGTILGKRGLIIEIPERC